jgi:hypothetical protein
MYKNGWEEMVASGEGDRGTKGIKKVMEMEVEF